LEGGAVKKIERVGIETINKEEVMEEKYEK